MVVALAFTLASVAQGLDEAPFTNARSAGAAQTTLHAQSPVHLGADGKLAYTPDAEGGTIPDFSSCGYMGGGVKLPKVPVQLTLEPSGAADELPRLQAAIDEVGKRPRDANGFRGAVLLKRGQYRINGTLNIGASGVVLRGEGPGEDGTILVATLAKQHTVITVGGSGSLTPVESTRQQITDERVPAGARSFRVADAAGFKVGDDIVVHRPSTKEWLAELKMDRLTETYKNPKLRNWQPGGYDINHYRRVIAIEGNRITIDVPIVQALEKRFGGGSVVRYEDQARIEQAGVEELRIVSLFDRSVFRPARGLTLTQQIRQYADEKHAWIGIMLDKIRHGWVSRVTVVHTGYGAVACGAGAIFTTVQDCAMLDAVSQHSGGRKYSFGANGQMGLFLRCYSRNARHDFVLGSRVVGPNAYLDCRADDSTNSSEPHHRYSVGCLWDNVKIFGDANLQVINRGSSGSGHGWSGAQMVFWNCASKALVVMKPPTGQNYAIGWSGLTDLKALGVEDNYNAMLSWVEMRSTVKLNYTGVPIMGDGYIESPTRPVAPRSLYLQQLQDRLGADAVANITAPTAGVSL
jgi:hypothetical protein